MGLFSGLTGSFLAGATERVSANWKEDREKMEAKIAKKTQLFYDDAKLARDKRREEKKAVKQQFEDALGVLGNDPNAGAVAEAMARLTPEQFAETKATLIKVRAEASSKGMGTDLRSLGVISDSPEMEKLVGTQKAVGYVDPATGARPDTISKFTGSSDDAVKRIMGTFEGTKVGVDPKENKNLRQGFLKHVGALSAAGVTSEAEREAAEQLGVTPERLRALRGEEDAFTSGVAPQMAGVNLGVIDPTIRREFESQDQAAALAEEQLEGAGLRNIATVLEIEALERDATPYVMTYPDGTTENLTFKQHKEKFEAIKLSEDAALKKKIRESGREPKNNELTEINKALDTVTGSLADGLKFDGNLNEFTVLEVKDNMQVLARTLGSIFKSREKPALRIEEGRSVVSASAPYENPAFSANKIYDNILAAQNNEGESSPYLNAIRRTDDETRVQMLQRIAKLAGKDENSLIDPKKDGPDAPGNKQDKAWQEHTQQPRFADRDFNYQVKGFITKQGIAIPQQAKAEYNRFIEKVEKELGDGPITGSSLQTAINRIKETY